MAEDDQVHGRLPDELAERLGQAPLSEARHPGSGRRKSLSPLPSRGNGVCTSRMRCQGGRGRLLSELAPFMNLLPAEIILSEIKDQELLRTILQDVGRHAYSHLVKYLNARPGPLSLGSTLNDFIPPPPNQLTTEQMVMLSECLDDAVDSIRDLANHPNFKDTGMLNHASRETIPEALREAVCVEMITPEMAATALTLLTASAFRRPPTRMVEGMMAASQEAQTNGGDGDSQREGTDTVDETTVPPPPASDDSLLGLACSTGLWELAMLMVRVRQSGDFMGEAECTPLMEACAAGHEKIVRQMIPYAADLNTQSATQNTALIYASAAGHLDCVEALLEAGKTRGIDLDLKNENGHCALMEAASGGHLEIVKRLIEAGSGSLRMNVNSEFKESPLTLAAYKGHSALVAYLLTLDLGETREEELHTALMEASMDGHMQVAEILLKAGAPVNLPSDSFESPLTLAACGGHTELVKLLIDSGASIEEPNDESYTPLMEAAREGHADVVRLLLEAGACVNATTEETGETAMTLAACGGFTEIVEMILESGGDLEAGANTPLMEAATEGHHHTAAGIIRMMKEHKLDKDPARLPIIIDHVSTALVQAADNGHYQIVREIATSGFVDLNFQLENRTPLMKAAKGGYRDIIRFLVQGGADVNVRAASGDVTALSLACAGGHYDTVAELLQAGADPNVILKDGVTCVLEAARHGYVHIVELLLDYRGGGAAGSTGPKPNRKVATPRRTVTAARKAAAAAGSTMGAAAAAAGGTAGISKQIKSTSAAASATAKSVAVKETAAHVAAAMQPAAASAAGAAPAAASSMASAAAIAAAVAAAPGKTREERVANAAAAAAARSRDPGAQASDMMKTMANHLPMPTKDLPNPSPSQMASFHRFHNFLVRTAKGENPPTPTMAAAMAEAAAMMPPPPAGSAPLYTSAEASAIMVDALTAAASPGALSAADAATVAAAIATAAAARIGITPSGRGAGGPLIDMADWIDSPSPCPSSPALMPLMTASSDEFVSETRTPVHVKRRSASVPHDRSNPRWPSDAMVRSHELHCQQQVLQQMKKNVQQQQPPPQQQGGTKGDAAPPPSKRPTGPNRQGAASRTGTVEKRPLAAVTSTFDVDMQTESNNDTPLTLACSNGHTAMVELLVQRGANVHHKDKKGFTPLILAATGGHLCIVRILLDHGANIETTSERTKDTALSLACSGGKKDVVEFLLKRGANKEHRNVSDYTPLSLAASGGYVDICNMLLDAGAEINSRTGSKLGISPLMLAAMNGHKEATRVLLERGSDINAQIETNRNTALTLACFQGRTEVVRLLLQYNANVEHRAKTGLTPLMEAANGGYVEVGQLLLEAYADPNTSPVPSSRDTALTIAADKGHEKFVDLLLKNGAAVDARNKKGCTALWLACHGGHLETVMTLVKHKKTNVEMEDNRKVSPLMIAFRKGHTKIVKFLVKWVSQFPGDAELCRYIQTVTEQELMTRCHECMNTIVTAKDKQAAQANLAADALIAQIEAEEEKARSKKLTKEKKKEKKKAKKQEKKKQEEVKEEESEDEEEEAAEVVEPPKQMPKEEPKKVEVAASKQPAAEKAKAGKPAAASTPLAAAAAAKGKARAAAAAAAVTAAAAARTPVETTPEREVERVEERIPGLNLSPPAAPAAPVAEEAAPSARKTAADRRAANRRSRNESGKNNGTPSSAPSQPLPSLMATPAPAPAALHQSQQLRSSPSTQQQQPVSLLSPLASPRGTGAATQEEWVKPSKKGRNAKGTVATAGPAARSSSATEKQKLTDPTEENALAMWNNIEASRRRMATLTVSSPCIARVIGRGGANINAIREATGASIEVERVDKALSRRDNIDREICIRGTAETVKNAVAMINGLIAETDVTVNEIIRLVRNSASPSDQPRLAPDAYGSKMAAATTATASSAGGRGASAAAAGTPSTTNVWQQRMAARQAQDAALRPAAPAAASQHAPTASSPAPTTRSDASSPVATRAPTPPRAPAAEQQQHAVDEQKQQPEVVEEPTQQQQAAPPAAPVPAPIGPPPSATAKQQQEEQERKAAAAAAAAAQQQRMAPGFARPAALNNNSCSPATAAAATHGSAPASPAPTRPTALPSTPLHQQQQHRSLDNNVDSRVPDLAPHMLSFGDTNESRIEAPRGSSAPSPPKQDLFNDSTFKSIAEIWGDANGSGGDLLNSSSTSGAFGGGAWDNALLLNSFNNISLSKSDWSADFTTSSSSVLDSSSASAHGNGASSIAYSTPSSLHHTTSLGSVSAPSHVHHPHPHPHLQQQQQPLHHPVVNNSASIPQNSGAYGQQPDPFATNGPRSGPLFARGANAPPVARAPPAAAKQQQGGNALDSIFNNVAAALIHHQTGSTTTASATMPSTTSAAAAAAAQSAYYPSPSYTDPSTMGLGALKGYGSGGGGSNGLAAYQQQQQQQSAFTRMQLQQQAAAAQQQLQAARMVGVSNGYPPAPPPGFNQLNSVVPPPSLSRSAMASPAAAYFGGQMAPLGSSAGAASSFHLYAQQNGWNTNGMPQKPSAPPTMNGAGAANGRGGASSFYSNGWN